MYTDIRAITLNTKEAWGREIDETKQRKEERRGRCEEIIGQFASQEYGIILLQEVRRDEHLEPHLAHFAASNDYKHHEFSYENTVKRPAHLGSNMQQYGAILAKTSLQPTFTSIDMGNRKAAMVSILPPGTREPIDIVNVHLHDLHPELRDENIDSLLKDPAIQKSTRTVIAGDYNNDPHPQTVMGKIIRHTPEQLISRIPTLRQRSLQRVKHLAERANKMARGKVLAKLEESGFVEPRLQPDSPRSTMSLLGIGALRLDHVTAKNVIITDSKVEEGWHYFNAQEQILPVSDHRPLSFSISIH